MNGIDKITARITSDAEAEAARITGEAAENAAEISLKWDDTAREEYASVIRERNSARAAETARTIAAAETDIRKSVLSLKQQSVSDAFDRALELIAALPEDKYIDFLARSAAGASVSGHEELIFNDRDRNTVAQRAADAANAILSGRGLPGNLTVSTVSRKITGGVIVRDGDIETNCSVETAAAALRDELASQLAGTMFE